LNESLPGRIFISYRRQETAWPAGRLYDVLVEHFPPEQVFKDVDNIDPGDDFVERITAAVASCDVLLALIGPNWLTITNKKGQRRLDDPEDYVRIEIETALMRKIRVIPILVDDAKMPSSDELPPALVPLIRRNAVEINPLTFDTKRLIATVHKTLELELARRQQELASQYAQASAAADAGDWEQAVAKYSMVAEAHPGYRDTTDRLAEARHQQLDTLRAEAQRLHQAGQWADVIKVGEQLQAIDPAAADPDGLMTSARAELAAEERAAALAADYHNGMHLFDAGRWEEAVAAFERVTRLDSRYQDVVALLGRARRELEKASAALAEEQALRQAEEQARRQAEGPPQRRAEEQAQRRTEEQDRARQQKEAEDRSRRLGEEQARREEEAARRLRKEQRRSDTHQLLRSLRQRAARLLSRRWVVVLVVSVGIGGAVLLFTYFLRTPTEAIMGQLPPDLRASCSADTDTSATCSLTDGTVVFYHLFDTATEAHADVTNGSEPASNGTPCPPSAPAADSSVVCRYAVEAETGVAAFSHTVKPPQRIYQVRWSPDAQPLLRGVMTTTDTTAQDWESLRSNWTQLAGMH
jgi:tetratricopeptide (TPR) repeat protein